MREGSGSERIREKLALLIKAVEDATDNLVAIASGQSPIRVVPILMEERWRRFRDRRHTHFFDDVCPCCPCKQSGALVGETPHGLHCTAATPSTVAKEIEELVALAMRTAFWVGAHLVPSFPSCRCFSFDEPD